MVTIAVCHRYFFPELEPGLASVKNKQKLPITASHWFHTGKHARVLLILVEIEASSVSLSNCIEKRNVLRAAFKVMSPLAFT